MSRVTRHASRVSVSVSVSVNVANELGSAFFNTVKSLDTTNYSSQSYLAVREVGEPDGDEYLGVAGPGEDELLKRRDDEHLLPPGHGCGGRGGQTLQGRSANFAKEHVTHGHDY